MVLPRYYRAMTSYVSSLVLIERHQGETWMWTLRKSGTAKQHLTAPARAAARAAWCPNRGVAEIRTVYRGPR